MERFGRFEVRAQLAVGGAAQLHLAIEPLAGGGSRAIALKRLLPAAAADAGFARAFRDEGRILASLPHPNVVRLYEAGAIEGVFYQALELVEGADVERFASLVSRVPEAAAVFIAREIALALSFAHARGIVHRDVTPENILIAWTGEVKLCDFGIALAPEREERTAFGIAKGKLDYMAPEQLRGEAADARADVFALGCVLHRLAAGESPIASAAARADLLAGGAVVLGAGISEELAALLKAALQADRAQRMASAPAFAAACDAILARAAQARPLEVWLDALDTAVEERRAAHPARELIDFELILEREGGGEAANEREPATEVLPKIGEYLLREMIGRGSTAIVYRAAHPRFGDRIALKVLRAKVAGVARLRRRFARESRMLASIDHPNVVRVFDAGEANGALYFATELLEGRSLRQVIEAEAPFAEERIASIAAQIARGLAAAHRAGIVHRDLKPANVMIAGAQVKIVDFGIAKSTAAEETSLTRGAGLLGTPGFMAPEQIANPSQVTRAADLYALGRVAAEMGARGALEPIVRALLAVDPAARPESAELVASMFEHAAAKTADTSKTSDPAIFDGGPAPPAETPARALRADLTAIAVLLAAVAALIATVAFLRTPPSKSSSSPSTMITEAAREEAHAPTASPRIAAREENELEPEPREATTPAIARREKRSPATIDVAAILAARKLRLDDLEASDAGRAWLERFRDPSTKTAAANELPALVEALPIDTALIRRRLERVSAAIRANREVLAEAELESLESAYFEQRSALQGRSAAAAFDAVLTLEAQLSRALLAPTSK